MSSLYPKRGWSFVTERVKIYVSADLTEDLYRIETITMTMKCDITVLQLYPRKIWGDKLLVRGPFVWGLFFPLDPHEACLIYSKEGKLDPKRDYDYSNHCGHCVIAG